jgi:hypothetical protein
MTLTIATTGAQLFEVVDNWTPLGDEIARRGVAESPRVLELRERLIARSLDDDGLDWDALARLNEEAWGLSDLNR